jgi:hypothetical protein
MLSETFMSGYEEKLIAGIYATKLAAKSYGLPDSTHSGAGCGAAQILEKIGSS